MQIEFRRIIASQRHFLSEAKITIIASPKGELLIQSLEISPLDGAGESPLGLDLRFQILFLCAHLHFDIQTMAEPISFCNSSFDSELGRDEDRKKILN